MKIKLLILALFISFGYCNRNINYIPVLHEAATIQDKSLAEIDEGTGFFVKGVVDALANGVSTNFYLDPTSASHESDININYIIETEAEATVRVYVDPIVSGGTTLNIWNRNLIKGLPSQARAFKDVDIVSLGTSIPSKSGSGKKAGGTSDSGRKFVTNHEHTFLVVVQNDTTADNWVDYLFEWYENGN